MAGKPDNFQLLEFQPKTVYLPDSHGGNAGSLRRPDSAEERADQEPRYRLHPAAHAVPAREPEYARVPRRSSYEVVYPREQDLPHPPEGMRQPLLQNPVYLLVPAGSMEGAGGKFHPDDTLYARAAGGPVLEPGLRRRRTYVRERAVEPYPEKGCCSCWKCMIALIVFLTIIGVGLAVTGIVFIKLINQQQNQPAPTHVVGARNGTATRGSSGSVRMATFPGPGSDGTIPAFDIDLVNATNATVSNDTTTTPFPAFDVTFATLATNDTGNNGTFDVAIVEVNVNLTTLFNLTTTTAAPNTTAMLLPNSLTFFISNGTNSTDKMAGVKVLEIPMHENGILNVTVTQHNPQPQKTDISAFDLDNSSVLTTTPAVLGTTFSVNLAVATPGAAFHHNNDSEEKIPIAMNFTQAIGPDSQGDTQRSLEEAHRQNSLPAWNPGSAAVGTTRGVGGSSGLHNATLP